MESDCAQIAMNHGHYTYLKKPTASLKPESSQNFALDDSPLSAANQKARRQDWIRRVCLTPDPDVYIAQNYCTKMTYWYCMTSLRP